MTQAERVAVKAVGFNALQDWPNSFVATLETISTGTGEGQNGPYKMFGPLYRWLQMGGGKRFDPLRRELRDFYLARWPATSGLKIFGARVATSKFVTLNTAADELGVSLERMQSLARNYGYLAKGALSGSTALRRDQLRHIREEMAKGVSTEGARAKLGVTRNMFSHLICEKIISSQVTAGRENVYNSEDLDGLLSTLAAGLPIVEVAPNGTLGLPAAAGASFRSAAMLIRAIRSGELHPIGLLKGASGLSAILIDVAQARALYRAIDPDLLEAVTAAKAMRLGCRKHLKKLVDAGLLERVQAVGKFQKPVHLYPATAVARFNRQYILMSAVSEALGYRTHTEMVRRLLGQSVQPILDQPRLGVYDRSQVRNALLHLGILAVGI